MHRRTVRELPFRMNGATFSPTQACDPFTLLNRDEFIHVQRHTRCKWSSRLPVYVNRTQRRPLTAGVFNPRTAGRSVTVTWRHTETPFPAPLPTTSTPLYVAVVCLQRRGTMLSLADLSKPAGRHVFTNTDGRCPPSVFPFPPRDSLATVASNARHVNGHICLLWGRAACLFECELWTNLT